MVPEVSQGPGGATVSGGDIRGDSVLVSRKAQRRPRTIKSRVRSVAAPGGRVIDHASRCRCAGPVDCWSQVPSGVGFAGKACPTGSVWSWRRRSGRCR